MRHKADVQEVPTVVLEISPGLLGLYGVWHYHDEAVPLLPVDWTFCMNSISKLEQNFTVQCRIHIFPTLLKMGSQHSLRISKHDKYNVPS
jgi:hypothetical protein